MTMRATTKSLTAGKGPLDEHRLLTGAVPKRARTVRSREESNSGRGLTPMNADNSNDSFICVHLCSSAALFLHAFLRLRVGWQESTNL